jgi:hypothetical protein
MIELINGYWSNGAGKELDSTQFLEKLTSETYDFVLSKAKDHPNGFESAMQFYCNNHLEKIETGEYKNSSPKAYKMIEARIKHLNKHQTSSSSQH